MPLDDLTPWSHSHAFGTGGAVRGERRTRWVVAITLAMMAAEVAAGTIFRSMALLADGWHMGTHAAALGVAVFAYVYARRHAADPRYSFGTGKVGALGGFASAVGLAAVALLVLAESAARLARPVPIRFDEAIAVAFVGLAVNLLCAWLLREHDHAHGASGEAGGHDRDRGHYRDRYRDHDHDRDRGHYRDRYRYRDRDRDHDHDHGRDRDRDHDHDRGHDHQRDHVHAHHRDHNLRAAYLHVLADALTSVFAIVALLTGKLLGWTWMDAVMGIVGAVVIARWSVALLRDTSAVLLDAEVPEARRDAIRTAVEAGAGDRVSDLHVWRVGPRHLAAIVSVVAEAPREPAEYKARLGEFPDLAHVTVEVHARGARPDDAAA